MADRFPLDLREIAAEGMSPKGIGILSRLMLRYWDEGGLPRCGEELSRVAGCTPEVLKVYWSEFQGWFKRDGNRYACPALDRARAKREDLIRKRREAGGKGGRSKSYNLGVKRQASASGRDPGDSSRDTTLSPTGTSPHGESRSRLRDLVVAWNGLPETVTTRRVRLNPIGKTYQRAWRSITRSPEAKHLTGDVEAIIQAVMAGTWLHGKPFLTLEWLLSRSRSTGQWNLINVMEGQYAQEQRRGRKRGQDRPEEFDEDGDLPVL